MAYHTCLLRATEDFKPDSFKTLPKEHEGKRFDILIGELKKREATAKHAYHYPTYIWTEDDARKH